MRVLVTGATGFVGSHAAVALVAEGHDVRVLARDPAKVPTVLGPLGDPAVEVAEGDMTDVAAVAAALDGCDAVVHAAADIGVSGGTSGAGRANVDGVANVVGGAVALGLDPVVYTSSISAYTPTDDEVITRDSPLADPVGEYGRSKVEAERLVREWQAKGAPVTTLVLGGVYGPDSPHVTDSAGSIIAALASTMVSTSGGCSVVDVRDLAELVARAMAPGGGPAHWTAGGHFVTWPGWIDVVSEAAGHDVPPFEMEADALVAMGRDLDDRRADGEVVEMPLSEEAARIMTSSRPTDDRPTLERFGLEWRPTLDTMRDSIRWLVDHGHLDPALAPAVAGPR